ncbi:DHHC palmitoyltransferase-domain-containing protein [Melampsora americana]|nr:DHHC palmitoyltransferase-domain-containing protein [Melampsora americana]
MARHLHSQQTPTSQSSHPSQSQSQSNSNSIHQIQTSHSTSDSLIIKLHHHHHPSSSSNQNTKSQHKSSLPHSTSISSISHHSNPLHQLNPSSNPSTAFTILDPERIKSTSISRKPSKSLRSISIHSPTTGRRIINAELHSGNNRFLCHGHLVGSGDSLIPFVLASISAIGIPVAFIVLHARWLWDGNLLTGGKVLIFIYGYLYLLMLSSMFITSWTDPGIIPRSLDPEPEYEEIEIHSDHEDDEVRLSKEHRRTRMERCAKPLWIEIGNQSIMTKWCPTCRTYRPPRTSHCRLCNNCVEQSDHHCTFLNNCIGRRNYFTFLIFLLVTTILVTLTWAIGIYHVVKINKRHIGTYITLGLSFIIGAPVMGLGVFHFKLLLQNLTTIETLRTRYENEENRKIHSLGTWWENCIYIGCRPSRSLSWIRSSKSATYDDRN